MMGTSRLIEFSAVFHAVLPLLTCPAMARLISSYGRVLAREHAHDLPLEHDHYPVRNLQYLVKVRAYEQHAAAPVPCRYHAVMHEAGSAYVKAAGRMYRHQQVRVALKLTGQYHLLLVAAGKIPCLLLHGYAAYVVLFAASPRHSP